MARMAQAAAVKAPARILGRIHRSGGLGDVFLVESRSRPGRFYRVEVLRSRLACPCTASKYTGKCAHRVAVHAALVAERAAAPPVAPPGALAMIRRSNEPFSLMK